MHDRTVPILRQTGHILDAFELPSQHFLERLDKAVGDPPGEFVEGDQLVAFLVSSGGVFLECVARPNVAKRDPAKCRPRRGPYGSQTLDEGRPEGKYVYASNPTVYDRF